MFLTGSDLGLAYLDSTLDTTHCQSNQIWWRRHAVLYSAFRKLGMKDTVIHSSKRPASGKAAPKVPRRIRAPFPAVLQHDV